ncbi:hypothetical protein ACFWY5_28270 [Nonomuraea sp. NPDC059007]|uniref:hypothetical protein n=1 Tax=Nonomuraea sp. NPDC059007 TaxID=3346692 RepID=UPI0036D071AB
MYGEGFRGRPLGEVAEALNRLLVDAYLSVHDHVDVERGLAALLVIRQLREDLQEGEGYVIESLRGGPMGHADTTRDRVAATRDHRAAQHAEQVFIAEHADRIREVGRRLASLGDLQQRADAAAAAIAPAENYIRAGQAACQYSWRMPLSRSCRRMFRSMRASSVIGSGAARSGAAWPRAW